MYVLSCKEKLHNNPRHFREIQCDVDFRKFQGTGEKCLLYWGFVISNTSIKLIYGKTTKMFGISRYINPAFPDVKNYCHVITFQYRTIHSYGTRNSKKGKQNSLKLLYTWMLSLMVCLAFIFYHMLTFSRYIEVYFTLPLVWIVFVITFNFGRAEENRSLYRGLRYIEVR